MARNPAPAVHPKDPILGSLKGFFDWIHRRLDAEIPQLLTAKVTTWDPPNVLNGAWTTITVTVPGAGFYAADGTTLIAMPAMAAITQILPAGCVLTAAVVSKDTVRVTLLNNSGGAVNIGAVAELRVMVWRYQ